MQLAVQKLIEIVGEALRQAEASGPDAIIELPEVRDVVDTRKRLVHSYSWADYGMLWDISMDELPPLRTHLLHLLLDAPPVD